MSIEQMKLEILEKRWWCQDNDDKSQKGVGDCTDPGINDVNDDGDDDKDDGGDDNYDGGDDYDDDDDGADDDVSWGL